MNKTEELPKYMFAPYLPITTGFSSIDTAKDATINILKNIDKEE